MDLIIAIFGLIGAPFFIAGMIWVYIKACFDAGQFYYANFCTGDKK